MRTFIAASTVALTITAAAVAGTVLAGAAGAAVDGGRHVGGGYVVTSAGGAPIRSCPAKTCAAVDWIPAGGVTTGTKAGNWLHLDSGGWAWLGKLTAL
ncbi:hypothetical protein [Nonomuraea sp. NPDC003754]